jgi:hypothetical protein
MLCRLLLRDLTLHRRVLAISALVPLLLLAGLTLTPKEAQEGFPVMFLLLGLVLLSCLPVSLHFREGTLGTLGDLLALPVARRDLVHLRYLEGVIVCAAFLGVYLLVWIPLWHPAARDFRSFFGSPFLLWMFVIFLAYPLPFALRWGGRGMGAALGLLVGGFTLWVYGVMRVPSLLLQARVAAAHGALVRTFGAPVADFGVPLLLLGFLYALSVWAMARVDA